MSKSEDLLQVKVSSNILITDIGDVKSLLLVFLFFCFACDCAVTELSIFYE